MNCNYLLLLIAGTLSLSSDLKIDLRNPIYHDGVLYTNEGGVIQNEDLRIQAQTIQYFNKKENGKEIHKKSGTATVGGGYEAYTFLEGQSGPTIIKFDNIRGSGSSTEFGLVVVPEFGAIILVLFVSMISLLVISKTAFSKIHFH